MTMTTVERVVALQRVPLFADVPGRTLAAVAQRATEVEVDSGGVVIEQGAVEDHLFAVVSGRLVAREGERVLRELSAGSTVGELAALAPEPRSAAVTVLFLGLPDAAESEGFDRTDIDLPADQVALLEAVAEAAGRVVVVLATAVALVGLCRLPRTGTVA